MQNGYIIMNSKNSKTSDLHRILHNLSDKINLKRSNKYVALSNLSIYYLKKNLKNSNKNCKFKISSPAWNDKSKLPGGFDFVFDIQDFFQCIIKKMKQSLIIYQ